MDERGAQFDVRLLESGDAIEVFVENERQWQRGVFEISTAGEALVSIGKSELRFEKALQMGLRRELKVRARRRLDELEGVGRYSPPNDIVARETGNSAGSSP